jgi:hypothetical protein
MPKKAKIVVAETRKKRREPKFSPDFFPTISASKLGEICGNTSEFTKIRFLRQFKPFSEIELKSCGIKNKQPKGADLNSNNKKERMSRSLLDQADKDIIKQHLNETIDIDALTFDDGHVIKNFKKTIEKKKKKSSKGLGRKRSLRLAKRMPCVHRIRNWEL